MVGGNSGALAAALTPWRCCCCTAVAVVVVFAPVRLPSADSDDDDDDDDVPEHALQHDDDDPLPVCFTQFELFNVAGATTPVISPLKPTNRANAIKITSRMKNTSSGVSIVVVVVVLM